MNVEGYLRTFERSFSTYAGDDPLGPWDRFVHDLEKRLPAEEKRSMSVAYDHLVQRFLQHERYHDDPRYVQICIKCADFHSDPITVYSYVHSRGIGIRASPLYISWAQHYERGGQLAQVEAVYQTARENQAEPSDLLLQHYRKFQKTLLKPQADSGGGFRNPFQNSQIDNQPSRSTESVQPQCKEPEPLHSSEDQTVRFISRSECNPPKQYRDGMQQVSMYCVSELVCEGSELCFEELRAQRYWAKQKHQKEQVEGKISAGDSKVEGGPLQKILQKENLNSSVHPQDFQASERSHDEHQDDHASTAAVQPECTSLRASRPSFGLRLEQSLRHSLPLQPSLRLGLGLGSRQRAEPAMGASVGSFRLQPPSSRLSIFDEEAEAEASHSEFEAPQPPTSQNSIATASCPPQQAATLTSLSPPAVKFITTAAAMPSHHSTRTSFLLHQANDNTEGTALPLVQSRAAADRVLSQTESSVLGRAESIQQVHSTSLVQPLEERENDVDMAQSCRDGTNNVSLVGQGNHSHVTPNTSFGLVQATPSRVLPSPTVNTREALEMIMDMFHAPTFVSEGLSQIAEESRNIGAPKQAAVSPALSCPPLAAASAPVAAFTIFQEEDDKENTVQRQTDTQRKPLQARVEVSGATSTQQNNSPASELMPDETAMWGLRHNSLAACPNTTRDFAPSAHLVSTPFHLNTPISWETEAESENDGPEVFPTSEENPALMRQPTKLSPIIEQSPVDDQQSPSWAKQGPRTQGTIVGEGLAVGQQSQIQCQTGLASSIMTQPLAALSFPDHTTAPEVEGASKMVPVVSTSKPSWTVYESPERPEQQNPCLGQTSVQGCENEPASLEQGPNEHSLLSRRSFHAASLSQSHLLPASQDLFSASHCDVPMSPEHVPRSASDVTMSSPAAPTQRPVSDRPMSTEPVPSLGWLTPASPMMTESSNPDMDFLKSSSKAQPGVSSKVARSLHNTSMPSSPMTVQPEMCLDVPMSPEQSPEPKNSRTVCPAPVHVVPDPWADALLASLMPDLTPSTPTRTSYMKSALPSIMPKMSITLASASLRVDSILGQGAFATVYQATDLTTSEKFCLKVQKPAHPWEFYIAMELDVRLRPAHRPLFSILHSAHVFTNGSILMGELYNCGTLLDAVNLYKSRRETMPHGLVLYFTSCILHMVTVLHDVRIIHADIKPDNFLLGERFLDNDSFDPENHRHGLALVDLGQSIDMSLFPEGTVFTAKCLTSAFQCTEMLSGRPWNYQTDYFGVAGTVYCMIFGSYMQVKMEDGEWKPNCTFKRHPHSDLWQEFFRVLLNVPNCNSLPCLQELRNRVQAELQNHYSTKLRNLKNRLVVHLLESRNTRR